MLEEPHVPTPGEEVVELRARVAALEADLAELMYVASHDLTEPLRMVTSYLGLLERRYAAQLDATAGEFIGYAVDGAERMRTMLDDLLRYSREVGEQPRRAPVAVEAVLAGVLRSLEPAVAETGATVEVLRPLPVVETDAAQLGQLLQNLVANAVKFRRPERPSRVTVAAGRNRADTAWELRVADDGIGISATQQERVFLLFQRLHSREEYAGTGVGLAVCRRIAERLGGALTVRSAPGEGSTFTLTLPDRMPG